MKKIVKNRSNSSNKPQDKFRNKTPISFIINERFKRQRLSYSTMIKASQNRETLNILPQDKIFRYESPDTISTKYKLKSKKRKFMLKLQRSETLPSKSQPEPRLNEPPRSNSLPNDISLSEFYCSNTVPSVSSSSLNLTQQNIYTCQLVMEPETYDIQTSGPNNETCNDEQALAIEEATILNGSYVYPIIHERSDQEIETAFPSNFKVDTSLYTDISATSNMLDCLCWHFTNELIDPQFQVNDLNITQSNCHIGYSDGKSNNKRDRL
ncbi:7152_t:CDS:2 [Dentiscutata erythropus]|uniref:7152_t:CDS:1 n=1 Tax=Dentiscutata erythropus TaxID=1348616 RepID=A0A9N9DYA4_9GLOM|nr:7152_t:CDS:2 [Dentiscutata erythropus]